MAGLLRSALPRSLARAIDWASLTQVAGSFVDPELRDLHADLLFTARIGTRPALLYVLCEHKSDTDPDTAFQLLRYLVRIWEGWRRRHWTGPLPPVLPFVLHHGERPWSGPLRLQQCIDLRGVPPAAARALRRLLPDLGFLLDDLATQSEQELEARSLTAIATVSVLLMQHARGRPATEVYAAIARWQRLVAAALDRHGQERLLVLWSYLFQTTEVQPERIVHVLAKLGPRLEEVLMSTAERLRKEGMAEGLAEGRAGVILRLLARRFGPLPPEIEARVRAGEPDDLDRWADAVLTAANLDEVFRDK